MTEPKAHHLKHLDYIQAVITRMAQHSFTLKGWCRARERLRSGSPLNNRFLIPPVV